MGFIEKLNGMVEELMADSEIHIVHYQVVPAHLDAIIKVELQLGHKLDNAIINFYKECGGVQLLWVNKNNTDYAKAKKFVSEKPLSDWYFKGENAEFNVDGSIWIPSIETVFLFEWNDLINESCDDFDESIINDYEGFRIQPFDWFSSFYDVAFILNGTPNPLLVLGNDHQASYHDSNFISFDLYFELLLKSKGAKTRVEVLETNEPRLIGSSDIEELVSVL